ncbi:hypothetical protein A2733_01285 [Candidatus Nomurabacteria bacterium RIFCSPHIGHO2_01_FULL_40_20]|uniref:Caib/baif family protein n=1 Tax=Candidatus Nomurabacteria bacterium RIFCSPHIGHO2_01_FULL_40_20 TaxID=1801738 RepID=A0A1F6V475_9BACT|nr:MAG: hypothetical protein A2733_01285 [Candidatus Nomurabacteria bacterium RIFCSPHIGHO2_01_FULL_40_20]
MQKRICQATKKEFIITDDEASFCEKIGVPLPTFSPEERFRRRLMRRNERVLSLRLCTGTGKKVVSFYDENVSFPVYSREYWYGDGWDGTEYGRDYDFSKSFFEQFMELGKVAPRIALWQVNSVNSDTSNYIVDSKNCYMCFTALGGNEDCMYSSYLTESTNCLDCDHITKCDRCYESFNCDSCYNCKFSVDSTTCRDSWFLRDCNNCSDCFGCVGLKDRQYYIWNEPYTKEKYESKLKEFKITSRQNFSHFEEKVNRMWEKFPHRYMHGKKNENVTGDYALNSNKCENAFFINDCEDSKNLFFTMGLKNSMDVTVSPIQNELLYECHAIPKQNYDVKFSDLCSNGCNSIEYCSNCDSSSNLFGCIGLRKKEYCILNKQYTKEEYQELIQKIKEHIQSMQYIDKSGRKYGYGEFFPPEVSPFAYNESMAQEHFPLNKKEAESAGYAWKELKEREYKTTMDTHTVPDDVTGIPENIAEQVIGCMNEGEGEHNCQTAFRIMPNELIFYKQNNIPLPRYCPNCRHHKRLDYRNALKLRERYCDCAGLQSKNEKYKNTIEHPYHGNSPCGNSFKTTYDNLEKIVYCEDCYKQEVS